MQRERELPVRLIQALQTLIQEWLVEPVLESTAPPGVPAAARVLARLPVVRDLPARLMAFGGRRPHVRSPLAPTGPDSQITCGAPLGVRVSGHD